MKKSNQKGIWIPIEIWNDNNLSLIEKHFLVHIINLDNEDGCYASNGHFAQFFNRSKSTCSTIINSLRKKKYVNIIEIKDGKRTMRRVIKVNNHKNKGYDIHKIKSTYSENQKGNKKFNKINNNHSIFVDPSFDRIN